MKKGHGRHGPRYRAECFFTHIDIMSGSQVAIDQSSLVSFSY